MKHKIYLILALTFFLSLDLLSQNIELDTIYWKESKNPNYGVCGVFNPETKTIEWKESKYPNYGLYGVYDPEIKTVKWKDSSFPNKGISGVSTFKIFPTLSNASIIFEE